LTLFVNQFILRNSLAWKIGRILLDDTCAGGEKMAKNKYGKYVMSRPWEKSINPDILDPVTHFEGEKQGEGANLTLSRSWISQPFTMIKEPHKHEFDQIVFFLGGNPKDIKDFGAEVEYFLGEEGEKYVITAPTQIYIPKGLVHGPLTFKRIDKPIEFIDIVLAPKYIRK
jgi:hypothetical protein